MAEARQHRSRTSIDGASIWQALVCAIVFALVAIPAAAAEQVVSGRVVGITDGDTLTLLTDDRRPIKVRLVEIDAPEKAQPWGNRAKQALSRLVYGKRVQVRMNGADRYGRTLGRVYAGALDINAEMVRSGSAWAYRQYLKDQSLLPLERDARNGRRGLWSLSAREIVAPWEWRHGNREAYQSTPGLAPAPFHNAPARPMRSFISPPIATSGSCASKHYCREMASCTEARFYLRRCGLTTIDGDGDGVPCEKLCAGK